MINIDSDGIPHLSEGWVNMAQPFVLNELWDLRTKYGNKCNIHQGIYDALSKTWSRSEIGWVLNNSSKDTIHYHDEYDRKKELFEEKQNKIEGIFQFGI